MLEAKSGQIVSYKVRTSGRSPCLPKSFSVKICLYLIALAMIQTACAGYHPPKPLVARDAQQIANVYVSAYPEVPWSDISALLSPNLKMTIQQAQAVAASTTAAQSLLVSTILSRDLAINFPTTATVAPSAPSNTPTTTQSAGTIPTLPAPLPLATPTSVAPTTVLAPVDGAELLVTGTSLFQQAAIIDNQISQQYLPLGYIAHLVTFQINLQPTRDDWSYDAFVDITLLPSSLAEGIDNSIDVHVYSGAQGPIVVKPLIISDALETSSIQRSIQQIQQALLQLSGSLGKTGAAAGFGSGSDTEHGISSYDKNSLVTAGRVSDDTIRVRLGAAFSALGRPILIPRTYNISLLVLTRAFADSDGDPRNPSAAHAPVTNLSVLTHTHFLPANFSDLNRDPDADYVQDTMRRDKQELGQLVSDTLRRYGYPAISHGCTYRTPAPVTKKTSYAVNSNKEQKDTYLQLLRAVDREDFKSIKTCLGLDHMEITDEEKFKFFYSEMVALQATTHFSSLQIPLKDSTPRLPEADQLVTVSESADQSQEVVTLVGGENLTVDQLRAEGIVSFPNGHREWLAPTSMTYSATKPTQLAITFPNPGALAPVNPPSPVPLTTAAPHGGTLQGLQLHLIHVASSIPTNAYYYKLAKITPTATANQAAAQAVSTPSPTAASPALKLCAAALKPIALSSPVFDETGKRADIKEGIVRIAVGDLTKLTKSCTQTFGATTVASLTLPLTLAINGAAGVPDGSCLLAANEKINLSSTGQCPGTLTLTNFNPAVPITLSVTDASGTPVGPTLPLIAP